MAIFEFERVLKPGGDLILITYNRFSVYGLIKYFQNKLIDSNLGRFRNPLDLKRELHNNNFKISFYSCALMSQPTVFPDYLIKKTRKIFLGMESLANVPLLKYFGERQVIRATKYNNKRK